MKSSKRIKWTPSYLVKRPDNIMSSEYTNSQVSQFVPSYEKDKVDMFYLMSMEYGRIWLKEKNEEKTIALSAQDNDFLVRRYVIRGLLVKRKEQEQHKRFIMKRFTNIPSKIKIRTQQEIDKLGAGFTEREKADIMEKAKSGKPITEDEEEETGSSKVM